MTDAFLVPDWLVGSERAVLRAVPSVAKAWARSYRASGSFPPPLLVDPGQLDVILYESSDFSPQDPAVRLFANVELIWKIDEALKLPSNDQLKTDYETHVAAAAWGSLESVLVRRAPASLQTIQRRYRQLLPHLSTLAHREVVSAGQQRLTALAVVDQRIRRTLENWGAPAEGPLEGRIQQALEAMARATPDEIDARIIRRMVELAPTMERVRHADRFTPESVRRWLSSIDRSEYLDLTGCHETSLRSMVNVMDRGMGR